MKRAYCSKECQQKDWSITGPGQRHNKWCGIHECGEEDVDWKVVPVQKNIKGLGIVAKKFFPTGYKIMVEAIFCKPENNPAGNLKAYYIISVNYFILILNFFKCH